MGAPPHDEPASARWERQVEARLAGLGPWLVTFWGFVVLIACGVVLLFLLPRA